MEDGDAPDLAYVFNVGFDGIMKNITISHREMIEEMIADHDRDRRSQDFEKVIVK